ncbi:Uncharacterised protein [Mycobacterium tuberculosis]|uniref:Uncharacterized protein n=1 Tax=Mycobacterium tuberculosis TaxID=1773 RepID=A0A655JQ60_MYCTX|nr:Uncharacterised protein [Mycobacterium tuberculosis]CKW13055.1 Uncharacterised protein [Mycobacterium tuberculosis]COX39280.1 Uncharacterised protein [Mycobacterium tuberculosis]COX54082.1 Uncharacterised protein [Mycobacterium tuberculosis]
MVIVTKDENAGAAALVWDGHCSAPAVAAVVALNASTSRRSLRDSTSILDSCFGSAWLAKVLRSHQIILVR